jgi:signal recognition particle subunit SRP19
LKQTGKMVVWPAALDSTKSRSQGRRLPKSQAVQTPRVDELELAGRKLSLDPVVTTGSALPRRWWDKTGYLLVKRGDKSRSRILRELAAQVGRTRQTKQ